jgi:2-polyprenyl-3-methyl-5-hydroxy-6-metoxy-1,4-benzoquinol methylase
MKNTQCYLCKSKDLSYVDGQVRDMLELKILKCNKCGLVFMESFDHISDTFYEDSSMINKDPGTILDVHLKENEIDNARRAEFMKPFIKGKSVLDFGCGNGGFLRDIKALCKDCAGLEKDANYFHSFKENKGIKLYKDMSEIKTKFDYITLFHVLEHIKDPKKTLKDLSKVLAPGGVIVVEVPNSNDALLSLYKSKAFSKFTYWSPHLFLFDNNTLAKLAQDAGFKVKAIKQVQRYPLSNHLYWLANNKPGGHNAWSFMNDPELNNAYEAQLAKIDACDTIIMSISKK